MKLRLLVAFLLIALSFGLLYVVVGPDALGPSGGGDNQRLIKASETESAGAEGTGIAVGPAATTNRPPLRISGSGRIRLPGEPIRVERPDGTIYTYYRLLLEGESETIGDDRLSVSDGQLSFFDIDPDGDKTLRGRIDFGNAIVRIGQDAEGKVAVLETSRQLELRQATVRVFGDKPITLRETARLLIDEQDGLVVFSAPPIEEIPQPILLEFTGSDGTSSFLEGFGVSGSFPIEEGQEDLHVRIDSDPLIRHQDLRLVGRGEARYDERAIDGAGLLVFDGGVEFFSEKPEAEWRVQAETAEIRGLRSKDRSKRYASRPFQVRLDGDVTVDALGQRLEVERFEACAGPEGDLGFIRTRGPLHFGAPDDDVALDARGETTVILPRAWLRPIAQAYGLGHSGIPSGILGLMSIGGPSETRFGDRRLLANDELRALIPVQDPGANSYLVADGQVAFRGELVVQSADGARVRRLGGTTGIELGPRTVDADHRFGLSGATDGQDLQLTGRGSLALERTESIGDTEPERLAARFESPRGDVTLAYGATSFRQLSAGRIRVLGGNRMTELDLTGGPRFEITSERLADRELVLRGERAISEDGLGLQIDGGRGEVEIETTDGSASGKCLELFPLGNGTHVHLEGAPARLRFRSEADRAEQQTADIELRAESIRTIARPIPDSFARLVRVPAAMGSGLQTSWIFARGAVVLDGTASDPDQTQDAAVPSQSVLANSESMILRADGRRALLRGSPAVARLDDQEGREVEARGPSILVDATNPDEPVLHIVPDDGTAPFVNLVNEGSDGAFERLRVECPDGISMRGGEVDFGGPVTVRAIDLKGAPVDGGLDLFARELDIDWDLETRTLRELHASGDPELRLGGKHAKAGTLILRGTGDAALPGYEIELLRSEERPVWFEQPDRRPVVADRVLIRTPDDYVRIERGRSAERVRSDDR